MAKQSKLNTNKLNNLSKVLVTLGDLLLGISVAILVLTFLPVIKEELRYAFNKVRRVDYTTSPSPLANQKELVPPNTDFSIVIPKIAAIAPIIANVDSQNPQEFLPVLKNGVAHAKGTAYPGEEGNVYLFAHSTDAFFNVSKYNAVFYLLGKLQQGDEVDIYYKGMKHIYKVYEVKVVDSKATEYLGKVAEGSTLTLQTCYPPGTTFRRLIILASLSK